MKAPGFWHGGKRSLAALLLTPFGWLYGLGTALRVRMGRPRRIGVPVVCVGNLIAGGTGKTPVVIAVAKRLIAKGVNVHVVTRGYGGTTFGPHLVVESDTADAVGDEARLLARVVPTWVSDDRVKGCLAAMQEGAQAIIFDDGFQDPSVAKALSFIVVDGGYGFGNGLMIPAGPLRESIRAGAARADAVVLIGDEVADLSRLKAARPRMVRAERTLPNLEEKHVTGRVLAFAGIGRPMNFFESLERAGLTLAETRTFADHHPYLDSEIEAMRNDASALDAVLMTTEKDFVRLTPSQSRDIVAVSMELSWRDPDVIDQLLAPVVAAVKPKE